LVTGLAQRTRQPLVLARQGCQARLSLAEALLKQVGLPGRISQPAAQRRYLLLKEGDLRGQDLDLIAVPAGANSAVARGHAPHPLLRAELPRPYLSTANT